MLGRESPLRIADFRRRGGRLGEAILQSAIRNPRSAMEWLRGMRSSESCDGSCGDPSVDDWTDHLQWRICTLRWSIAGQKARLEMRRGEPVAQTIRTHTSGDLAQTHTYGAPFSGRASLDVHRPPAYRSRLKNAEPHDIPMRRRAVSAGRCPAAKRCALSGAPNQPRAVRRRVGTVTLSVD